MCALPGSIGAGDILGGKMYEKSLHALADRDGRVVDIVYNRRPSHKQIRVYAGGLHRGCK